MEHPRRPNQAPISSPQDDTDGDLAQDQSGADPSRPVRPADDDDRAGTADPVATDRPLTGSATGSAGGYGVGSGVGSSGGSGDGRAGEGDIEGETDWLRDAPTED